MKWYRESADQGNYFAQFRLGYMFEIGGGVPEDKAEAVKWYRLSAEQGNADGQYNLATMYHYGEGISQNKARALKWYEMASDQGDLYADVAITNIYHDLGLYTDAKKRVVSTLKKLLLKTDVDQSLRAEALWVKGLIQMEQNDKIGCAETFGAVSKIYLELLNDEASYANILVNLGICQISIGLHQEGRENLLKAKTLYLELFGENSFEYANVLGNIAYSYELHPAIAVGLYEEALGALKVCCPENKVRYALYLGNLAEDLHKMGNLHRAREIFQIALEMKKQALNENHPELFDLLVNYSKLLLNEGDQKAASKIGLQAFDIFDKQMISGGYQNASKVVYSDETALPLLIATQVLDRTLEIGNSYLALQYYLGNKTSELINRTALIQASENLAISNLIRELAKLKENAVFVQKPVTVPINPIFSMKNQRKYETVPINPIFQGFSIYPGIGSEPRD